MTSATAVSVSSLENATPLLSELRNIQPGWKRIWIHASRRKAIDRDILLAEEALYYRHIRYGSSRMLWMFLTTYERYRFYLRPDADERALWIASFWIQELFRMKVEAFQAWQEEEGRRRSP